MAAFNKFNQFVKDLADKVHNLGSDTLKFYLTNTLPVATNTVYNTPADLSTANGYTAGGVTATYVSDAQTSGTYKLILGQPTITASGGTVGPFQYVVLYNSTDATKRLIGWYDYGAALSITSGNSFQILTDQTNGVLQLA